MDYKIAINTTSKLYFLLLTGIKTARNVEYSVTLKYTFVADPAHYDAQLRD